MDVKSFCDSAGNDLIGWQAKLYDAIRKIETLNNVCLGTSIELLVSSFQKRQLFLADDFLTSYHGLTRCRLGYIHFFR